MSVKPFRGLNSKELRLYACERESRSPITCSVICEEKSKDSEIKLFKGCDLLCDGLWKWGVSFGYVFFS